MVNYSYFNRPRLLFRASGKCLKGPFFLFFIVRLKCKHPFGII